MNDKKDYTEEVLPDGLNLIQFRVKRALDSAERELKRSFYLISKDINGFKSDAKNIRTEEEKMALLYRINSSKSTINVILEERPLLKDFVTNIKIDGKILTKLGYGSKVFEIMRERERSQMEAFQKELLKLEDEVMSIDFTKKEKTTKPKANFSDIIQYSDKEKLLKRLHELIDGRSGADVGCIILSAKLNNYIIRNPTRKEFESEFEIIGSWTAITNYFSESNNALDRANKIVLFEE